MVEVVHEPLLSEGQETQLGESDLQGAELRKPGQSAAEALQRVPGVQVARQGAPSDFATASIRGATSAQTPVYLGGIRLNDDVVGSADVSAIPLWLLRRIRVYRGHAPLRVARLSIGGAIVAEPLRPRGSFARLEIERGSFGHHGGHALVSVGTDKSSALVGVRYARARNDFAYEDDNGTLFDARDDRSRRRKNADYRTQEAWAVGRLALGRARLHYLLSALEREQGLSGTSLQPAHHARLGLRRGLAGLSFHMPCRDAGRCEIQAGVQARWSGLHSHDPLREIPALLSRQSDAVGRRVSERVGGWFRATPWLELGLRLRHNHAAVSLRKEGKLPLEARRHSGRALAQLKVDPPGAGYTVQLLGAGECHNTAATVSEDGCGTLVPTGRLAASWRPTSALSFHGGVGRYVRMPTLGELYGTSSLVRGNDSLLPERAWSGDVGLRWKGGSPKLRVALEIFGFARWTRDGIIFRQTSLGIVSPGNLSSARVLGAEAVAAARLWKRWRLQSTLTLLDPRALGDAAGPSNTRLPYRAGVVASLASQYRLDLPLQTGDQLGLGLSYHHRSARVADAAGLVVLPIQRSLDADLSFVLLQERLTLRLVAHNLSNNQQVDLLSAPLPGRRFSMALQWQWPGASAAPSTTGMLAPQQP